MAGKKKVVFAPWWWLQHLQVWGVKVGCWQGFQAMRGGVGPEVLPPSALSPTTPLHASSRREPGRTVERNGHLFLSYGPNYLPCLDPCFRCPRALANQIWDMDG